MASSQPQVVYPQSFLDENIGDRLTNIAIVFCVLETVFVVLRIWSRRFSNAVFGWDDILILTGFVSCLGLNIDSIVSVKYGGAGRHVVAVSPNKVVILLKAVFLAQPIIYSICVAFPKLAILILYLKIFLAKWSRFGCYLTATVLILTMVVNILTIIWSCIPIDHLWDPASSPNGHCSNAKAHFLYGPLPNIVTDVAMLLLPIPTIWNLHTERKMKIGIYLTFLTGSIGLVTSIIRFTEFFHSEADITFDAVSLQIWNIIETGVYLIASCLIACRPLVSYVIYKSLLSSIFAHSRKISQTMSSNSNGYGIRSTEPGIELGSNDGHSDRNNLVLGKKSSSHSEIPDPYGMEDV